MFVRAAYGTREQKVNKTRFERKIASTMKNHTMAFFFQNS